MNSGRTPNGVNHELLNLIVDAMPLGIVVIEPFGKIVMVNRETERLFRYGRDELSGQTLEVLLPERFRALHPQHRKGYFSSPQARTMGIGRELFALRKDGSEFPVEIGLNPITTEEGSYTLAAVVDISERFRVAGELARGQRIAALNLVQDAEEARKRAEESEDRLNLALSSSGVGTWNWNVVEDLVIWDDYIPSLFDLQPGALPVRFADVMQILHADDRERVRQEVMQTIEDGETFDTEYRIIWPDGSLHSLAARGKVYRDVSGRAIRMSGVNWDVTEQKRREEELKLSERRMKQAEERFRATVEAAPTAMLVVDAAGVIVLVNRQVESLFGYQRTELIGQGVETLMPLRFRDRHFVYVDEYFRNPVQRDMGAALDLFGLRKDGSEFPAKIGLSPVATADGLAVICGVLDVTDQLKTLAAMRHAKESAESASRAKSSFLANMSHEIRTPMNGIIGMAQLLAQTELKSNQRDYLATVDESAHILLRLLNDILDFSKIEAGKLELECVSFRVSECVAHARQLLALRAAEKGLEIARHVSPDIPVLLLGDAGRVQQVLVNLLGNAVKFTEAGEIFVNVDAESITDDKVNLHFSIRDTGIGIPADKLEQIFRPFEQAEASTTRRFGGTGLGLTISRQLVEMMHGKMWVESNLGVGSTFHFTVEFGVSPDPYPREPAELDSLRNLPVSTSQVQPRSVLLVEDNEINRRVALGLLRNRGHQVAIAENGLEATITLDQQEFDVVLMDMQMPVMDGYEATTAIRKREHQTGGHIPIVAMTAEALKGDREHCLSVGMDDYVSKPITPAELFRAVERFPAICLPAGPGIQTSPLNLANPVMRDAERQESDEPTTATISGAPSVIDWGVTKDRFGDDPELLREFSNLARSETMKLLGEVHRAIESKDAKLLRRAAHTIKSSVNYFGAAAIAAIALAIESLDSDKMFDEASEMLPRLEQEISRFWDELTIGPPD